MSCHKNFKIMRVKKQYFQMDNLPYDKSVVITQAAIIQTKFVPF